MKKELIDELVEYIRIELNLEPDYLKYKEIEGEKLLYVWEDSRGGAAAIIAYDKSYLFADSSVSFDEHFQEYKIGRRTKSFAQKEYEVKKLIDKALETVLSGTPTEPTAEVKALIDYGEYANVVSQLTARLLDVVEESNSNKRLINVFDFKGNQFLPYPSSLSGIYRNLLAQSSDYMPSLDDQDGITYLLAVLASFEDLSENSR